MDKKVLVAYFSRTGEQYSVGNIKEGNTAQKNRTEADKKVTEWLKSLGY